MDLMTLRRSPAPDAKAAGVCAGLAAAWRIDPLVIRIAFGILALGGGVGLVLYAAAWAALPKQHTDRAALDGPFPGWRRWPAALWIGMLVVGSLLTSSLLAAILPFGVAPSLVILAVWYFGFHRPRSAARSETERRSAVPPTVSSPFAEETEFTRQAAAWQQRVHEHLTRVGEAPAPDRTEPGVQLHSGRANQETAYAQYPGYSMDAFLAVPDPAGLYAEPSGSTAMSPRRRTGSRALLWGGIAASGLAIGLVALLDVWLDVRKVAYPAAALLVIGLCLVAGTRWGRPRGFLALGVVLSLATLGSLAPHQSSYAESGTTIVATTSSEIPARVDHDTGPVTIDLSQTKLTKDERMEANLDLGELVVRVPKDARVRVEYSVDGGGASILGKRDDGGLDITNVVVDDAGPATGPVLTIVAHVDLGRLEVTR